MHSERSTLVVKKILNLSLILIIGLSPLLISAKFNQDFFDVQTTREDYPYIHDLVQKGIIDSGQFFRPEEKITRAEFTKIIVSGTMGVAEDKIRGFNTFPDVSTTEWYWPYVQSARYYGFLHGYKDGNFKPGNQITRAEAIKIIINSTGIPHSQKATRRYRDFDDSEWFAEYAYTAFDFGIYEGRLGKNGLPQMYFNGADKISRGEMASYFSKAMKFAEYYNN